jgi:hypothetical protein
VNSTQTSKPPLPPTDLEAIMRYVDRLLDGPTTSESWHSPSESVELLRRLGTLRTFLRQREQHLLRECIDGNGDSNNIELNAIAFVQHQAWRRYLELLFGGRIKWETTERLKPLNAKSRKFYESFISEKCLEQRRNLLDWLERGPVLGRDIGDEWQLCPDVWSLIKYIGLNNLNDATIAACYLYLFKQFPSFPETQRIPSLRESENAAIALAVKPTYAIWELQQIAKALGIRASMR